jgi:voltage-gated potassium channel
MTTMSLTEKYPRNYWFLVITVWTIFIALYLPLGLIFPTTNAGRFTWIELISTLLFSLDLVYYQLSLGRLREEFHPHHKQVPFRQRLFWFLVDLPAALPLGLIFGSSILSLSRLLKLVHVGEYFHNWRRKALRYSDYLKMALFGLWFLLFSHWMSCGWLALSPNAYEGDRLSRYISALYWVIQTLTTVGYGETAAESNLQKIYAIILMCAGVGIYGYVIGTVAGILAKRDPAKAQYFSNLDQLKAFVQYREIPPGLQKRIRDYYAYIWKKRLGFDETQFLSTLPQGLAGEVSLNLKREILERIPLFKGVENTFIEEVALNLRMDIFTPGELIFKKGQKGQTMYFVIKGNLEVFNEDGVIINTLSEGDFFGEIALLTDQPRTAWVRALSYCDLYALEKDVFTSLLERYPEIGSHIRTIALQRQNFNT